LGFPTAVISSEFMNQEQRIATTGHLVIEIHTMYRSLGHLTVL
jgi:hypothetical protein